MSNVTNKSDTNDFSIYDYLRKINPDLAYQLEESNKKSQAQAKAFEVIDAQIPELVVPKNYTSQFPVDYTDEQLKEDIVDLFLIPFRYVTLVSSYLGDPEGTGDHILEKFIKSPNLKKGINLMMADKGTTGLTFEDIKDTPLAEIMISLHQYAYHGVNNLGNEFEPDTNLEWYVTWLQDMSNSEFNYSWDSQNEVRSAARRCYRTAEIANLRSILEGNEGVFPQDGFSIRDMSLLSGMEEMSIRAAANPKRTNPLKTFKYKDGSTTVSIKEAKRWLISKKRYVPITTPNNYENCPDLQTAKIYGIYFLANILQGIFAHRTFKQEIQENQLNKLLELGLAKTPDGFYLKEIDLLEKIKDEHVRNTLADVLSIDQELLNLKYQEAITKDILNGIERKLNELQYKNN